MVSSSKWPVSDYEFEIAESLNMTHRGLKVTYNEFVSGTINGWNHQCQIITSQKIHQSELHQGLFLHGFQCNVVEVIWN